MHSKLVEIIKNDCAEVITPSVSMLDSLKNRLVYITGGTGFVGTWITETIAFLNDNYRFNTYLIIVARNIDLFREKVPHLAVRKDVTLVSMNVRNIVEIPGDVSYILHAAATPDNRQHMSDPLGVMDTITKGTNSVLDAAIRLPDLKKVLSISSGQVYGSRRTADGAVTESSFGAVDCNTITSVYPEAKRYAETLCCAYWSLYKIPAAIARPFAFIGPYQSLDKPWAVNNFIRDALMNIPIRIIGNGLPVRSYMYPSDMAYWLLRMLIDGKPGVAYNVGSPEGVSLNDLARKIKECSDMRSDIVIKNMNDDRSQFIPDISLSKKELGLDIKVNADDAVKKSIAWFKEIAAQHAQ